LPYRPSKESYKLSSRFIISEVNSKFEHPNRPNLYWVSEKNNTYKTNIYEAWGITKTFIK
jgi:hypothetical protein